MTCADVRHHLLTADLSVLRGESDGRVAEHLAGCTSCAAAAALIVEQSRRLGAALAARPSVPVKRRSPIRRTVFAAVPIATAAGIALIAFLAHREITTVEPTVATSGTTKVEGRNVEGRDGERRNMPKGIELKQTSAVPSVAQGVVASRQRSADSVRVAPLPQMDLPAVDVGDSVRDSSMSQVRVIVRGNQGATVIRTSNPKITVVLLTRGGSQ
jgi:hypothetical protein